MTCKTLFLFFTCWLKWCSCCFRSCRSLSIYGVSSFEECFLKRNSWGKNYYCLFDFTRMFLGMIFHLHCLPLDVEWISSWIDGHFYHSPFNGRSQGPGIHPISDIFDYIICFVLILWLLLFWIESFALTIRDWISCIWSRCRSKMCC